ncbi:tic 20-i, chloroplastic [Olea europaea subsp. europaea]|uniref:Protein TIC 20 n=1 Tax=Olea europaea subsp. europaea TaxID=158383 RepID=A0A8S0REU0_OLEEU|nr:tic 20-i, chloroplastic [Olea europaea subsp. europaea]
MTTYALHATTPQVVQQNYYIHGPSLSSPFPVSLSLLLSVLICRREEEIHRITNRGSKIQVEVELGAGAKAVISCSRSSLVPLPNLNCQTSLDIQPYSLSTASSPVLNGEQGSLLRTIPKLPRRHKFLSPARASKDVPYSYRYPAMTKKPKWWWRSLACLPYLMPLHETWMYAETAYHLHPFLEDFELLTYPFLGTIGRLPSWFLMAYFFVAYLGIVRRKEWPHFFRFHVVMGMLLEIALQVIGTVSRWMPLAVYWGKVGMHFWTAVAFAYLFTVLECMRCALAGMYADIPFVCDAAYIQIPYN